MPEEKKSLTRADKLDRVYLAICRGLDRVAIIAYAGENQWKEKPEAIDELIQEANERLAAGAAAIDVEVETGKSIVRLTELYQVAFKCQDFKTALSIQKEINKQLEKAKLERRQPQPTAKPERRGIRLVR